MLETETSPFYKTVENLGAVFQTPAVGFSWREGTKNTSPEVFPCSLFFPICFCRFPCFLIYYFMPVVFQMGAFKLASPLSPDYCFTTAFIKDTTRISTGRSVKTPKASKSKNPTSVNFEMWWFLPCPAYLLLHDDCVSLWQREEECYIQKSARPTCLQPPGSRGALELLHQPTRIPSLGWLTAAVAAAPGPRLAGKIAKNPGGVNHPASTLLGGCG